MRRVAVGLVLAGLVVASSARAGSPDVARGDAAYARRGEGQVDGRARPEPIGEAIAAYEAALAAEPRRLEIHWKLIRALWFAGDFTSDDKASRRAAYERGQAVADRAFAELAERVGGAAALEQASPEDLRAQVAAADVGDTARLYFWAAINLGAWARDSGLWKAVRAGVANRLHDHALRAIALDPAVEQGGALRLLSRLHAQVPYVPLVAGWVDRAQALPLLERAAAEYPAHPGNRYLLALTILDLAPDRRAEAIAILEETAARDPRPEDVVEDAAMRRDARTRLAHGG